MTLDRAGHKLSGSGFGNGAYFSGRSDVTLKNIDVVEFSRGMYLADS